mgnify:CR=1 FL=1
MDEGEINLDEWTEHLNRIRWANTQCNPDDVTDKRHVDGIEPIWLKLSAAKIRMWAQDTLPPICTHCGEEGHVSRECQIRLQEEAEAQEKEIRIQLRKDSINTIVIGSARMGRQHVYTCSNCGAIGIWSYIEEHNCAHGAAWRDVFD